MNRHLAPARSRRGAISTLAAFLLIPLVCMLALSVDVGYMYWTKAQLQNAADAAALAGAQQLVDGFTVYKSPQNSSQSVLSSSKTTATSYAKSFAGYNQAGGVKSLALNDSDIVFGSTNASGTFSSSYSGFPNAVQVTMRRDGSANGSLGLFFARIFGVSETALTAKATATIYTASTINRFDDTLGINGKLLPVAYDVNAWNQFLATGKSPDGMVYTGPNGAPQLQVYPSPGNAPGNFGLLSTGPPSTNTPTFSGWIRNGSSPNDLKYINTNKQVPASPNKPTQWAGGPGMKSSLKSDFAAAMGQTRLMPIFEPVSTSPYKAANGSGSNASYDIVGFAGVTITQADGSGNNMNISVQPVSVFDPTAIYDSSSMKPAGTSTQLISTVVPPKLTE